MFEAKVREFLKVKSKKHVAGFRDGSLQRYQTTTNDSMAFVLKILCLEKLYQTRTATLMKIAVFIHQTGVNESNGDRNEDIAIGTGGVGERTRSTIDSP